jgi:hypothetical protein
MIGTGAPIPLQAALQDHTRTAAGKVESDGEIDFEDRRQLLVSVGIGNSREMTTEAERTASRVTVGDVRAACRTFDRRSASGGQ